MSAGRDCSPGSPRSLGARTPRLTPLSPRASAAADPGTAPHVASACLAWMQGREGGGGGAESWGPSDSKFVLQTQRSPSPSPSPPCPRALAAPPWPPRAARPEVREAPLRRQVRGIRGQGFGFGGWGGRVAFPGEKALLGVGPGVRHVQTCSWGAAHLVLGVDGTGGWKGQAFAT